MGASEGPPQLQLAVLALIGVLAFILIVGGVWLYRFRSSSESQKTEETQVTPKDVSNLVLLVLEHLAPLTVYLLLA